MYSFTFTFGRPADFRNSKVGNMEARLAGEEVFSPLMSNSFTHRNNIDKVDIDIPVTVVILNFV